MRRCHCMKNKRIRRISRKMFSDRTTHWGLAPGKEMSLPERVAGDVYKRQIGELAQCLNPQPGGPGFYFRVPSPRRVAFSTAKEPLLPHLLVRGWYFISHLPAGLSRLGHPPIRHLGTRPLGVTGSPEGPDNNKFENTVITENNSITCETKAIFTATMISYDW